jgi:hypothetical protein
MECHRTRTKIGTGTKSERHAVRDVCRARADAVGIDDERTRAFDIDCAATACYAIEGAYPPTVEYLTGKYGVTVDSSRFAVFYEVFAENLMPEISVKEK